MKLFTTFQNFLRKNIVTFFENDGNKHHVIHNKAVDAKFKSIFFEIRGLRVLNKASQFANGEPFLENCELKLLIY